MEYSVTDLEQLALKAQKGDTQAFGDIFDALGVQVSRYIAHRVDPEEVEDLTSEVFLKVIEKLSSYKKRKDNYFRAWVFRIAHNHVIDFYRKKKAILGLTNNPEDEEGTYFLQLEDQSPRPDQAVNAAMENKKLLKLIKLLPPSHREILELKYLQGFENEEIAQVTGKSLGNIRIIQMRALRHIRELWDKH